MDLPALKHRQDIALGVAALEHPGWIVLYTWSVSQFHLPHGLEEGALGRPGGIWPLGKQPIVVKPIVVDIYIYVYTLWQFNIAIENCHL